MQLFIWYVLVGSIFVFNVLVAGVAMDMLAQQPVIKSGSS